MHNAYSIGREKDRANTVSVSNLIYSIRTDGMK